MYLLPVYEGGFLNAVLLDQAAERAPIFLGFACRMRDIAVMALEEFFDVAPFKRVENRRTRRAEASPRNGVVICTV